MTVLSRRRFAGLLACAPLAAMPVPGLATVPTTRALSFDHLHTGERLHVEYFDGGRYVADALSAVDHLLRDFRTGDVAPIDPALLDLLHVLQKSTSSRKPFQIISGYRSPATNAALHRRSPGVASGSLHMRGQAIDVRLADVALPTLRDAALALRAGGVGYYPDAGFVHVDTGRVRAW